jgi:rfaE bifunctional protein kinase chain/domain
MTRHALDLFLRQLPQLQIAVVGDFFLDQYLVIDPTLAETSVETGLEAHQIVARRLSPGAAGTIVSNLSALGVGGLHAVGIIGIDGEGFELKRGLADRRASLVHLVEAPDRFTPTYTKPMRRNPDGTETEMNRQDIKNRTPTPRALEQAVIERLRTLVPQVDGVIVQDQVSERDHGVVTDAARAEIAALAAAHPDKVFFGDARQHIGDLRGIIVKPNESECVRAVRGEWEGAVSRDVVGKCGAALAARNGRPVFVTLGADGILLCDGADATHIPTIRIAGPLDIVGAGDSTTAGIVSALCAGASLCDAAVVGNVVASITIQQIGTTGTATPEQVRERFEEFERAGLA